MHLNKVYPMIKKNPDINDWRKVGSPRNKNNLSKKGKKNNKKFKFIKYFECSAKTGQNVDKIFEFLTRAIMKSEGYF